MLFFKSCLVGLLCQGTSHNIFQLSNLFFQLDDCNLSVMDYIQTQGSSIDILFEGVCFEIKLKSCMCCASVCYAPSVFPFFIYVAFNYFWLPFFAFVLFYAIFFHSSVDTVQDFLIKLGIKLRMYLLEICILSLNNVIVRPTKIMNRANKNWEHFKKTKCFKNQTFRKFHL